jgi:hypothetical protein
MTTKAPSLSPYLNMIAKKRPWQAVPVDKGTLVEGGEATLFRALALRHLELPVREFLQQGLEKDLPSTPGVVEALIHNQKDEERHDEALNYIAAAHGVDEKAENEAQNLRRDEISHVGIHSLVARELGETAGQSLNKLRRATALWIFDQLGESSNKWLNKSFWLRQSDHLFERGKAEELADTQRSRMVAFFESPNTSLPSYGKA